MLLKYFFKFKNFVVDYFSKEKTIILNFISLGLGHFFFLGASFLVTIFLFNRLSTEVYGTIFFVQFIYSFLAIIVDYGFNITAVKKIAIINSENKKFNQTFSETILTKAILSIVCFTLLFILINILTKFSNIAVFLYFGFVILIARSFNVQFFFQGIEKMKFYSFGLFFSSIIYLSLTYFFVINDKNAYLVNFFLGLSNLISSFFLLVLLRHQYAIKLTFISYNRIIELLKENFTISYGNVFFGIQSFIGPLLLGFLTSNVYVGYYNLAEKFSTILKQITGVIGGLILPKATLFYRNSEKQGDRFLMDFYRPLILTILIISIILFFFSNMIMDILVNKEQDHIATNLKFLALVPLFTILQAQFSTKLMVFNQYKILSNIFTFTSVFYSITIVLIVPYYFDNGLAFITLLFEIIISTLAYYFTKKYFLQKEYENTF